MAITPTKTRKSKKEHLVELFGAIFDDQDYQVVEAAQPSVLSRFGDDFDILSVMREAEDPDTGLLRDLRIDDRDLPQAGSYYDYAFNIIGGDANPPWLIQMWTALLLFAETCPPCSDKRWYNLEYVVANVEKSMPSIGITEFLQPLRHGKCPKCKRTKLDLIQNHGLVDYNELVNVLGQRSGKSSSAASLASYATHRWLKFPKLGTLTQSMQKSTELTGTFVSLTFDKAFSLLWTPYSNIINESRWFQSYHSMLDHYGQKHGTELYRKKDLFLKYYHKGLNFYPTNPKAQTLRGDTRIFAAIDELGLFPLPSGKNEEDETSDRANADEAHKSLTNSLVTVQAISHELMLKGMNCPPALMFGVSSPMSIRDKVWRLYLDSKTDEGKQSILGINLPTWKVNPSIQRNTPIIVSAYRRNAEKAERDFGANPPKVHSAFLKQESVPLTLWTRPQTHVLEYQYDQPGILWAKTKRLTLLPFPSLVTIDAGYSNNSFCLTAAHFNFQTNKTEVSTVLEIMPHDDRRIDFNLIYENVILPVLRDVNAVGLLADQWQSLDLLSRAKADMGLLPNGKPRCLTKQHSPKRKDFNTMQAMCESGNLLLPKLTAAEYQEIVDPSKVPDWRKLNGSPAKHLLLQLLTIKDVGETRCPEKGDGFTDDIARTLVLQTNIHSDAVMQRLKEAKNLLKLTTSTFPKPRYYSRG